MTQFFVGSTNQTKVNAVTLAVQEKYLHSLVEGFAVSSEVSHQPMSDEETRQGAENRARGALAAGLEKYGQETECLGIGLEGGVYEEKNIMWSTVWGIVITQDNQIFSANGARIPVPEIIAERIRNGEEMGPIIEAMTKIKNLRQRHGMFGVITAGFVSRTEEYASIAKMAIGQWYGRDWQKNL